VSDLEISSPQVNVEIDREAAPWRHGDADRKRVHDAYGPRWVSTIYGRSTNTRCCRTRAGIPADPSALSLLYFKGSGPVVPLDTLATVTEQVGPQTVNHYSQLPVVTVSFGLPGASLGDVLSRVRETAAKTVPVGVTGQFQGGGRVRGAMSNLAVLLRLPCSSSTSSRILYESYIHPLTTSGLPSAAFGALPTLMVFRMAEHLRSSA
jgi:HAE1 family hydrophobic/amphiphilic exporter-1